MSPRVERLFEVATGGGAGHHTEHGAVFVEDPEPGLLDLDGDDLPGVREPDVDALPASCIPPRHETRRWTRMGPVSTDGGGPASLRRAAGGLDQRPRDGAVLW